MKRNIYALIFFMGIALNLVFAAKPKAGSWQSWLEEVAPIMTRLEKETAKLLTTVEDRDRFQEAFWRVRDPDPATAENEFRQEFYRRREYAQKKLNGPRSDRGKIYVLLGKPLEVKDFSGYQDLVDCELWAYSNIGKTGLPPFLNLLFFRYHNMGDYQLYYPGIHKPADLLNPFAASRNPGLAGAYRILLNDSPELAQASLSVLPGEADPELGPSVATSGIILADIYSLPEKQVETRYIQGFRAIQGRVEVSHSSNEIRGKILWAISRQNGIHLINYALIPDFITFKPFSPGIFHAEVVFYLTAEDSRGSIVYQNNRKIELKFPQAKLAEIQEKKLLFRDFFPIIPGKFKVSLTYINRSSGEFFTQTQELIADAGRPVVLFGWSSIDNGEAERLLPFSAGRRMILNDPRGLFSAPDSLFGIVEADSAPQVTLTCTSFDQKVVSIDPETGRDKMFLYRFSLKDLADGTYRLDVRQKDELLFSQTLYLMPVYMQVKRPYAVEKSDGADSLPNFRFILGQEYLNSGSGDEAIRCFNMVPADLWNGQSLPVIARAYYLQKDFARTLELLEKEGVEKNYANLLMLANSALDLKQYAKACQYLEALRNYGDTAEISRLLAAAYLSQGNSERARFYYDHARKLDAQASPMLTPAERK